MNKRVRICGALLVSLSLGGCAWPGRLARGYAEGRPSELSHLLASNAALTGDPVVLGMARFVFDDMGGLSTDGLDTYTLPWKVVAAALVLRAHDTEQRPLHPRTLDEVLSGLGFITPSRVVNWRGSEPSFNNPIGLLTTTLSRGFPRVELEAASVGCAGCHAGVLYDPRGNPTREVWLGAPNTSINLERYIALVFEALSHFQNQEDRFWDTLDVLYPALSDRERSTIRKHVLPRIRDRFEGEWAGRTSAVPFANGSAGLTNGVGSLKHILGLLGDDVRATEVAFTSIPDLGGTGLRSSLLYDGTYGLPGRPRFEEITHVTESHLDGLADITTFFTVPTLGIAPDRARDAYPRVRQVMDFLYTLDSPRFPGPIDSSLAAKGERIYRAECQNCHGEFSPGLEAPRLIRFPNRLVPQEEMGTDPRRWELSTPEFAAAVEGSAYGRYLSVDRTGGYVATPLTALWISAPYLHNGSVPTLWHLMHPEERPERFMVGGHQLDFERVGIAGSVDERGVYRYLDGYDPWAVPALYDTRFPGKGRQGHEAEFARLSEDRKRALLEYLKLL